MKTNFVLMPVLAVALSILGLVLAQTIPSAVFPELVFPRAIVLAEAGDLPPEQMLVEVTRPMEQAAYGVIGVLSVRSTTTRGSTEIDVTFSAGSDPVTSFQLLGAALGEVRGRLPQTATFDSRLLSTGTFPILDISLTSKIRSLPELTDLAINDLLPSLHRIDGVFRVDMVGAKYREFVVRLDPGKMLAHNLSPQQVVNGLTSANVIASVGRVSDEHRMVLEVVSSDLTSRNRLAEVALSNDGGLPVLVRDVGDVDLGIREDYIRAGSERGPAVLVGVTRQPDGSTVDIANQAKQVMADFGKRYPDVNVSLSYDQSALVQESFSSVRDAIIIGLVLSVAVVFLFTGSILSAAIAMLIVPACILSTFAIMKAFGLTFNMMTLGGLAAGIGLFIDDAIVMIEAIHRRRSTGWSGTESIEGAVGELTRPLIGSTLTVIVVLAPPILLSGVTGTFFRSLAATLSAGLLISLGLALYVTPAIEIRTERWRPKPAEDEEEEEQSWWAESYLAQASKFFRSPRPAAVVLAIASLAAFLVYQRLGTDYLPELDEGAFVLDFTTPPQSTMADTEGMLRQIDRILKATPEVAAFARRTGTQLGFFLTESNRGDISVRLRANRSRSIYQVMDGLREEIETSMPGIRVEFSQILQDLIGDLSGLPEPVEVKVFGPDDPTIQPTARTIATKLRGVPGLVDVFDGIVFSNPEEHVTIDTTAAERFQVSADDIRTALQAAVVGSVATSIRSGDRLLDVRVRYPELYHERLDSLSQVMLTTPVGRVPLSALVNAKWSGARAELQRERLRPVLHVTARLNNTDLGTAMKRVRKEMTKAQLPPGSDIEYGGLYADQTEAFQQLTMVMGAGIVGVLLILLWEFSSLGSAIATLAGALPCIAGSFLALALTGVTLNISSFMGLIMVVGIAAKNGILLIDQAQREISTGDEPLPAMMDAARIRIRPILMTTIATAAGLLPLALGFGAGAKVQQPLAIVVIGGLLFSLLFSVPLAGGIFLWFKRRTHNITAWE